jgi:hypothetical protein
MRVIYLAKYFALANVVPVVGSQQASGRHQAKLDPATTNNRQDSATLSRVTQTLQATHRHPRKIQRRQTLPEFVTAYQARCGVFFSAVPCALRERAELLMRPLRQESIFIATNESRHSGIRRNDRNTQYHPSITPVSPQYHPIKDIAGRKADTAMRKR